MTDVIKNEKIRKEKTPETEEGRIEMTGTEMTEAINYMRKDSAMKNKRGIAFIGASIAVWLGVLLIQLMDVPIETRNLYSWFAVALLMPMALMLTKSLGIKMQNKENPLNKAGMLFTMNQILYICIVCWVYAAMPERMIMVLAMIFGGHLLPFSWLYSSKAYAVSAVIVVIGSLVLGCRFPSWVVAAGMLVYECLFTLWLSVENMGSNIDNYNLH